MLLVGFGPEERQESVAPMEPTGGRRSQIAEQGDPFGLGQNGRRFTPGLHSRGDPAKQSELDGRDRWESRKAAVTHAARLALQEVWSEENCGADPNVTLGPEGGNRGIRQFHAGITSGERVGSRSDSSSNRVAGPDRHPTLTPRSRRRYQCYATG